MNDVYVRYGQSNSKGVAFVFFPSGCTSTTLSFTGKLFQGGSIRDLVSESTLSLKESGGTRRLELAVGKTRIAILEEL
jgi:hypothetical protein